MPSSYTTSLKLTLPVTGELAGQWGQVTNDGITKLVDDAVAGTASITVGGSDYTLTNTDGAANEARKMFITATGTPGAARNVIVPAVSKLYFVFNNTTGGFALTFKTSGGTGIAVAAGARMVLYCDGTNVVNALNAITLASPLPTSSGGTGLSSFTANRVFYASSTSAVAQSANLTFDGTTLGTSAFTATGNVNLNGGTFTFNDAGADLDARFEGDTDPALLFLDAGNDRVGIGTSSPATKLHLGNNLTTANTIPFQIGYAADFYGYRLINTNNPGTTAAGTFSIQRGTTAAWVDVLTSDNSGNVGIGTASPATKLHVSGGGTYPVRIVGTDAAAGGGLEVLNSTGTGVVSLSYGGSYSGGSLFNVGANGSAVISTHGSAPLGIGTGVGSTGPLVLGTNSTERMRITAAGDVGIGTSTPNAKLLVQTSGGASDIAAGFYSPSTSNGARVRLSDNNNNFTIKTVPSGGATSLVFSYDTDTLERMRITAAGDVGIGTNSPTERLTVSSSAVNTYMTVRNSGSSVLVLTSGTGFDAGGAGAVYTTTAVPLSFGTNSTERMRITSSGDVGIGTSSPFSETDYKTLTMSGAIGGAVRLVNGAGTVAYEMRAEGAILQFGSETNHPVAFRTNDTERMRITSAGNISAGAGAVATTATDGFLYVPTCAGTPTGTPTTITGMAPIVVNTTNNKLYFYSGGQWRDAGP